MDAYDELMKIYDEVSTIAEIDSILYWDQNTYMPKLAAKGRGGQNAYLSTLSHRKITDPRVGEILKELDGRELEGNQVSIVREISRIYKRKTAIPEELEAEIARLGPVSVQAWVDAKRKNDFKSFSPYLKKMIDLKREVAEKVGYPDVPYDAMLEEYEPYTRTGQVREIFARVRKKLVPIVEKITSERVEEINLEGSFPQRDQERYFKGILTDMGYDWERGRLDETEHPFTVGSGFDTRITTHYHEDDLRPGLFACMHEGGHALYEQGFREDNLHTPLGEACSLGIHESQSRMWENMIGRSLPFWKHYYNGLQETFPSLKGVDLETFHRSINQVRPSFIRIEADEVTYNLHVLIRFEIEMDIFDGKLEVDEIPQAWNDRYESYMGIRPQTDSLGCLQDVHWSDGLFGYFPTYTLGNLYSAQFFDGMQREMDVDILMERGELSPILSWLRTNIHEKGKRYPASELVKMVTGSVLNEDHFIDYLKTKFGHLYGITL